MDLSDFRVIIPVVILIGLLTALAAQQRENSAVPAAKAAQSGVEASRWEPLAPPPGSRFTKCWQQHIGTHGYLSVCE